MKMLARVLDLGAILCLMLWLTGGVELAGRHWLKHGADPRRAALLLGFALLLLLLVRLFVWSFDGNAERFGMIHALTLTVLFVVLVVDRKLRR